MYRVVIIGCGKVGVLYEGEVRRPKPASHAGYVVANSQTKLVALVDTSLVALKKASKLFPHVNTYTSVRECLEKEHPDIVVIATPPDSRLALIQQCIQQGVQAIICEKPFASTTTEARAIATMVKKSNIVFVLNYPRRFAPLFTRVRSEIASGKLGAIQQVTCYYSNGLYNNGGHLIDTLSYLLGETMKVVWAQRNTRAAYPVGDPCVDAVLETKKGTRITLQSLDQDAYGIFDIRVLGTRGERVFTDYGATLTESAVHTSNFKEVHQLDRTHAHTHHGGEGRVLDETLRILAKKEKSCGAAQGLAVMQLLDSINHATKNQ